MQGRQSVKRFERSNGLDTALYKTYLFIWVYAHVFTLYTSRPGTESEPV